MTVPHDQAVRRRAATDLETTFLVEASAGSGKTTLLVERILAWVRSGRAGLTEIAAITFTEKAAADLRVRVREALEAARLVADARERPRLDQALAELELCPIRTIHGFCADLLRERPVEAGIDPGFAVADPLEAALVLDETWTRWLESAVPEAGPELEEAIALGVRIDAVRALAHAMVRERDQLTRLPGLLPEEGPELIRRVRERLETLAEAGPSRARHAPDPLASLLQDLLAAAREIEAMPPDEQGRALLSHLRIPPRVRLGTQTAWGRERLDQTREALAALGQELAEARAVHLHNLTAALAGWLTGFVRAYVERLRGEGRLDFHDLLVVTRDLLQGRPDVRADFQRRLSTVLVDEFQDTDPLQVEIAFFLGEDPSSAPAARWEAVRLGPGRLFLVGDPKQSIYRFRRADIETYERVRAHIETQGEVLRLSTNFRAGRRLLAAVNRLFEAQMQPPADGARYQPPYAPVVPPPGAPDGEDPLLLEWPEDAPPPGRASERRAAEAALLAGCTARAIAGGAWMVRDRLSGAWHPAGYGDVVCLFRTLVDVTLYEDAFRAAGVPYRTLGGRHYYGRSEVGWALAALTAIEDPHDPVALVATLRSPFFGASDGTLLAHVASGGTLGYLAPLPASADPILQRAVAVLADLHHRRVRERPVAIVEALFAETEVLAAYALDPHGDQRVANLLRILDTARALEARGRGTFRQLVRWLRAQDASGYEESETPIVEEGDQVVRLMTVHAAKGLEFPVVVLPDLAWDRMPRTPPLLIGRGTEAPTGAVCLGRVGDAAVETRNLADLLEREARREAAEALRLFYVATTRARDHLVLPLTFGSEPRGFAAFAAPLLDAGAGGARRLVVDHAAPDADLAVPEAVPTLTPCGAWREARAALLARGAGGVAEPTPGDERAHEPRATRAWPPPSDWSARPSPRPPTAARRAPGASRETCR